MLEFYHTWRRGSSPVYIVRVHQISELQNTVSLLKSRLEEGETECEGRNFVEELEQSETVSIYISFMIKFDA